MKSIQEKRQMKWQLIFLSKNNTKRQETTKINNNKTSLFSPYDSLFYRKDINNFFLCKKCYSVISFARSKGKNLELYLCCAFTLGTISRSKKQRHRYPEVTSRDESE